MMCCSIPNTAIAVECSKRIGIEGLSVATAKYSGCNHAEKFKRTGAKRSMREYAVIYEAGPNNWSAYVPDLPGCISTGKTQQDIERNIQKAIELHIEGMLADGEPVPEPSSIAGNVRVRVAA